MAKAKSKYYFVFRSAVSGAFVSEQYAKRYPKRTVRERRLRQIRIKV